MSPAANVFLSGLAGVFAGIGLLYLMMKLLARLGATAPDRSASTD